MAQVHVRSSYLPSSLETHPPSSPIDQTANYWMGGVDSAEAAIEMRLQEPLRLEFGTANFTDPYACPTIIQDLPKVMDQYGITSLEDLRRHVRENLL